MNKLVITLKYPKYFRTGKYLKVELFPLFLDVNSRFLLDLNRLHRIFDLLLKPMRAVQL